MNYYVDESGNDGLNFFNREQPYFYYGVVSSPYEINEALKDDFHNLRKKLKVDELHGTKLNKRFNKITKDLISIIKKGDISFDIYYTLKEDLPLFIFYEFIFDSDVNHRLDPFYDKTKMKEILFIYFSRFINKNLRKKIWKGVFEVNSNEIYENALKEICLEVIEIIQNNQIISNNNGENLLYNGVMMGLLGAYENPSIFLHKNTCELAHKKTNKMFSPNSILFSRVLVDIKSYAYSSNPIDVFVDYQKEFNDTQEATKNYLENKKYLRQGLYDELIIPHDNKIKIHIVSSKNNNGVQLADILTWCFKYLHEKNINDDEKNKLLMSLYRFDKHEILSLKKLKKDLRDAANVVLR